MESRRGKWLDGRTDALDKKTSTKITLDQLGRAVKSHRYYRRGRKKSRLNKGMLTSGKKDR